MRQTESRQKNVYRKSTKTTTSILRPFSGTTRVSQCQKRTSGLYAADHLFTLPAAAAAAAAAVADGGGGGGV